MAKFLGIAYIAHSSYLVTVNADKIHSYLKFALIGFYVIFIYKMAYHTMQTLQVLESNRAYLRDMNMHD